MLELLCPAGSMEALVAAVQNGADAVYLGAGDFNARRNAKNFDQDQLKEAVSYCHQRGVALHLTLNTLVTDRQCPQLVDTIAMAVEAGVDAFIVQDWGVLEICRKIAPQIDCHGSTQMSIHSLEGAEKAAQLGCSRVVLARELSREDYLEICSKSTVEIEVFGHGALCMCHSGQCYFSALVGRRSGNRGQCAQPCRLPYGYGKFAPTYPLSLKDSCLLSALDDLKSMGVSSLKIEGRMKRPEYVAAVTAVYRKALDGGEITGEDLQLLELIFSREGFTSGYFDGKLGKNMFGIRQGEKGDEGLFSALRATYEGVENRSKSVKMAVKIAKNEKMELSVWDGQGHQVTVFGEEPQVARNRALTAQEVADRLSKTGGTVFQVSDCNVNLEEGLMVPASQLNGLRRDGLDQLFKDICGEKSKEIGEFPQILKEFGCNATPEFTVSVTNLSQVTPELLASNPAMIYVPLHLLAKENLAKFEDLSKFAAILPRVVMEREKAEIFHQLETVAKKGITHVLGGNLGHLTLAKDFTVHGDFGLNLFNSHSAHQLKAMGFSSVTASFELLLAQIRDLSKPLPTEVLVYGRLPLMVTENCLISWENGKCNCGNSVELVDRKGEHFPLLPDGKSCRTVVYNGKILYLLDRLEELQSMGLWAVRLAFTTESPQEVDNILGQYRNGGVFDGEIHTKGLYVRGVT